MKMNWDKTFSFASWVIVIALLYAAVMVAVLPPAPGGPVGSMIGPVAAKVFYVCLYGGEAMLLAISKVFKRKVMRRYVLLVIYLTGFFTSILTIMLVGFSFRLIDNLLIAAVAAGCWLYWTFKTRYIDPKKIYEQTLPLRNDLP